LTYEIARAVNGSPGWCLMVRLRAPQQDIGVSEDAHLSRIAIDTFAADGVIGKGRGVGQTTRGLAPRIGALGRRQGCTRPPSWNLLTEHTLDILRKVGAVRLRLSGQIRFNVGGQLNGHGHAKTYIRFI
jgi:hypothetical protein